MSVSPTERSEDDFLSQWVSPQLSGSKGSLEDAIGGRVRRDSSASDMSGAADKQAPRRRSTRDIKRPKFDDEIVESSVPLKSPRKLLHKDPKDLIRDEGKYDSTKAVSPELPSTPESSISKKTTSDSKPTEKETSKTTVEIKKEVKKEKEEDTVPLSSLKVSKQAVEPASSESSGGAPEQKPKKKSARIKQAASTASENSAAGTSGTTEKSEWVHTPPVSVGKPGVAKIASNPPKPATIATTEEVGRWTPCDDLALITAVMQANDLKKVYTGIKFSCKFKLEEVKERWHNLLYDPHISKLSVEAMKGLSPDVILQIQSTTLFSREEERILCQIPASNNPCVRTFEELLERNTEAFLHARTPRSLYSHWQHLRQARLLSDQTLLPWPTNERKDLLFSDLEENLETESDPAPLDPVAENELWMAERNLNRHIRTIESEIPKWQVLVESVTGISPPDFDPQTMAVLRGRLVRFLVRSREITVGRSTNETHVDVDLSLEGPAFKVSRKQATIKLRSTGEFLIGNDGKRPVYVDGKPLLQGCKTKLDNNSVLEIASIRLVFLINQDLMNTLRSEATKMMIA